MRKETKRKNKINTQKVSQSGTCSRGKDCSDYEQWAHEHIMYDSENDDEQAVRQQNMAETQQFMT